MALELALVFGLNASPQIPADQYAEIVGWLLLIGGLWWAAALTTFMWPPKCLNPRALAFCS